MCFGLFFQEVFCSAGLCTTTEARFTLFISNIILSILSSIGLSLTAYIKVSFDGYARLDPAGHVSRVTALGMGLFLLVVVVSVLGLVAVRACSEKRLKMYLVSMVLLAIITVSFMLMTGLLCRMVKNDLEREMLSLMTRDYGVIGRDSVTRMIDEMQRSLMCCGVNAYLDWRDNAAFNYMAPTNIDIHGKSVPTSCCVVARPGCNEGVLGWPKVDNTMRPPGCLDPMRSKITSDVNIILGFCGLIALGALFNLLWGCMFKDRILTRDANNQTPNRFCPNGLCGSFATQDDHDLATTDCVRRRHNGQTLKAKRTEYFDRIADDLESSKPIRGTVRVKSNTRSHGDKRKKSRVVST